MVKLLYIHGYNSTGNSNTATQLKASFEGSNLEVYSPDVDPNPDISIPVLTNYIKEHGISIVMGSSLGGFLALKLKNLVDYTIICNPCVYPSIELPKIGAEDLGPKYKPYESDILNFDNETRLRTTAFLGLNDEIFSYKKELEEEKIRLILTDDYHRMSTHTILNTIVPVIKELLAKSLS